MAGFQLVLDDASIRKESLEGVLIESTYLGNKSTACSGILFADNFIITHGSLISSILDDKILPANDLEITPEIDQLNFTVIKENKCEMRCFLNAWWLCPLLNKTSKLLYNDGWRFGPDNSDYKTLGLFLILGFKKITNLNIIRNCLEYLLQYNLSKSEINVGNRVLLESTPFCSGNLFMNSWCRGSISSKSGDQDCLILCDIHAAPGSEGGGIYYNNKDISSLIAIMILPFSIVRGESVALCLCGNLRPIISNVLNTNLPSTISEKKLSRPDISGIVCLKKGNNWASAVCIDNIKGIFLTCSHVLNNSGEDPVIQWKDGIGPQSIDIIYNTPNNNVFDIGLIQIKGPVLDINPPKISKAIKGEDVIVVGYGVLVPGEHQIDLPLISKGCVTSVNPYMLQTSCTVHSGTSGGAVLRQSTGELLGIIVGHIRLIDSKPLPIDWPRFNFSIPAFTIAPIIKKYLQTDDPMVLNQLEIKDPNIIKLWQLGVPKCASHL